MFQAPRFFLIYLQSVISTDSFKKKSQLVTVFHLNCQLKVIFEKNDSTTNNHQLSRCQLAYGYVQAAEKYSNIHDFLTSNLKSFGYTFQSVCHVCP